MSTPLLICDDSNMARKQVARSLPDGWDVDISFATNGFEGIEAIKAGKGDVLLLDLNMPGMDGYEVLQAIVEQDLPTLVIVISGDIQPEAHQRVTSLGALDFIQKPVSKEKLTEILSAYGVYTAPTKPVIKETPVIAKNDSVTKINPSTASSPIITEGKENKKTQANFLESDLRDCYQEIANVAMGRAGDLLARLLDVFVVLPIPNVNLIEVSELSMALSAVEVNESTSGICQGFIGAGVSGEALLILNDSSFKDVATLMNYQQVLDENSELELLMDMANVLIGACLSGVSEQLDMNFSQGHPVVLGQHRKISELIATNSTRWRRTLAIEISYSIENYPIKCDLLLLFTEESMKTLNNKISYLLD
ncbi:response regulator [Colwellia sp. UCD-KL20]|uniref:response regulator n=1 Tax=Colwellia sp. UCD-KL20 TaxID=1917165 RepID=UPI0009711B94|nr:response regulator [Colwellia sp. UCD-KL20]